MVSWRRDGWNPSVLPEPYGSMLGFLSDLHEQVEARGKNDADNDLAAISRKLCATIEAAGLTVMEIAARSKP